MLNRMWRDAVATANPPVAYIGRLESFLQGRRNTESMRTCMPPTLCMPCDIDTTMPWWKESHVCNYDREGVCYSCGYTDGVIVGACVCGNIWCTLCDGVLGRHDQYTTHCVDACCTGDAQPVALSVTPNVGRSQACSQHDRMLEHYTSGDGSTSPHTYFSRNIPSVAMDPPLCTCIAGGCDSD